MDLKTLLPKKPSSKSYWSLVLEEGLIQAAIWQIKEKKVEVLSVSPPTVWELDEELIEACDTVLSSTIQALSEEFPDPKEAVFGVPVSWVGNAQIKEEYLEKIKAICSKMSLTPVGFVVLPEAIAHFIKSEEGSPLSAVVIGVSENSLEFSFFKMGNILQSTKVARSVSVTEDVEEAFGRFSAQRENFPSRFILYNSKEEELEEVRQLLIKADWDGLENTKLLHPPRIEIIDPNIKASAVCLAGGAELGNVDGVVDFFAQEEDEKEVATIDNLTDPEDQPTAEELGFVVNKDIGEVGDTSQPALSKEELLLEPHMEETSIDQKNWDTKPGRKGFNLAGGLNFGFITRLKNLIKIPKPKLTAPKINFSLLGSPLVFGLSFLAVILLAGGLFWWFIPKAEVTVFVSPIRLDEKVSISVDPNEDSVDVEKKVLPGNLLTLSVNGEKSKATTGTKTVGDRASGEVTLYRVGSKLELEAGERLNGPEDLDFTLDEDVTIASGSASSPGTTKVSVTAVDIGAQYNLAANTNFSVANFSTSDIEAKNEGDFSGGSSREIQAVSEEDRVSLLRDLEEELKQKARDEIKRDLTGEDYFIEESFTTEISSENFSAKVGDEAENFKLNLEVDAKALIVERSDLYNIAKIALESRVPEGFVVRDDQLEAEFEFGEESDGVYLLDAFFSVNLLPQIDPTKVARDISGKYPQIAQDYFKKEVPGFVRAQIIFKKFKFPGKLGTLPRVSKNIEVSISAER